MSCHVDEQQQHFFAKKLPSKLRQQSPIDFFVPPAPATNNGSKPSSTVYDRQSQQQEQEKPSSANEDFNVWASKPSPSVSLHVRDTRNYHTHSMHANTLCNMYTYRMTHYVFLGLIYHLQSHPNSITLDPS